MAEVEAIALREAYGHALVELGHRDPRIVAVNADLAEATRMKWFAEEFPDRFFNFGIAEQGMMTAAAGMASCGKIPFVSSFACFAAGRAWEAIRLDVCYNQLNVKVAVTHAGIGPALEGAAHQMNQDLAIMRVLPNMTVLSPADQHEARKAVLAAAEHVGPVYIRLGREVRPIVTQEEDKFEIGKGVVLRDGGDVCLIATGLMVSQALEAAEVLGQEGVEAKVINIHTIKPLDQDLLVRETSQTRGIVVAEEHSVIGGLGGAVAEALMGKVQLPFKRIGVPDRFSQSGKPDQILEMFGMTSNHIAQAARNLLG